MTPERDATTPANAASPPELADEAMARSETANPRGEAVEDTAAAGGRGGAHDEETSARRGAIAEALADTLLGKEPRQGRTRIVAVDGQSGAGKTTFAASLTEALRAKGASVSVVHTDDLLDGWDDQFTFWDRLMDQVVNPLRHGLDAAYYRYDWNKEQFDEYLTAVPPDDVVIVEGVSAAREDMRRVADLTVFLRVTEEEAWRRLKARDPEDAMPFLVAWKAREGRHFGYDQTPELVDVVIDDGVPGSAR